MELLERLPLDRVVLEITEHAMIEDYAAELATLERLGVANAQGYLFHKRLSWDDLRPLLPGNA